MGTTQPNTSGTNGYVPYEPDDLTFFGAAAIVNEEREHIYKRHKLITQAKQEEHITTKLTGLALSGGGIRSASFSLGILQALSYRRVLEKIDYLSTVSGGGYIGSSLTWLLSRPWMDKANQEIKLGVDKENFPYGTYPMLAQDPMAEDKKHALFTTKAMEVKHRGALLRYLRQHGKYLTPGYGINGVSLLGVVLRGSILSIFIYFSLLVLILTGLENANAYKPVAKIWDFKLWEMLANVPNYALLIALLLFSLFVLSAPLYSFVAFIQSRRKNSSRISEEKKSKLEIKSYKLRRFCEKLYNYWLVLVAMILVVGIIPEIYVYLKSLDKDSNFIAGMVGGVSTAIGFLSSVMAYIKTSSNKKGFIPINFLVLVGTIALWFGLLLLAYHCSLVISSNLAVIGILAALVVFVGWFANLNYISVHRYYRDRLMEAFMPDVPRVLNPEKTPEHATWEADKAPLSQMCGYNGNDEFIDMPYHLINCNLVLVSSQIAKFRGRGGDNFILSPAYCGSNATGWQKTNCFMGNHMTLPTAMAISGAAVNPSTGVGGDGMTRQPFLSMLMGFLNIRLGYWAAHPNPEKRTRLTKSPNFFLPGFFEMFFRNALKEDSRFLQLSDGGHFENLGIYELVRRKTKVIIACDGAADKDYEFTDLANALEKIRADFGVLIEFTPAQLESLVPKKKNKRDLNAYADSGFIMTEIKYPDRDPGILIYIKSTFFEGLSADLYGYKQTHKEFPDEPTSDQFFDEKQFEAYRELGYQTAWQMMLHKDITSEKRLDFLFKSEQP